MPRSSRGSAAASSSTSTPVTRSSGTPPGSRRTGSAITISISASARTSASRSATFRLEAIHWRRVRQPVVLDDWPVTASAPAPLRFTTIASWRGPLGRVARGSTTYGVKAHEFRKFIAVPTLSELGFEIALDVDPADGADVDRLRANGWHIVDAKCAVPDPPAFRRYVQHSSAEFSVAQGIYVETQSGWFSDRTVRYLASGKPAVVQETGWSRNYPSGQGLLHFTTVAEAVDAANDIASDYAEHSRAARAIAEEFFDSDKVLTELLETVGA